MRFDTSSLSCIFITISLINRFFLQEIKNPTYLQHKNEMMQKMQTFLVSSACRRRILLKHFDSNDKLLNDESIHELCCDNCTEK
jgi:superfamily II DNA helicase RecQ